MTRSKLLRALTVAGTIALSAVATTPAAHAAASSCTHDWSGPQICIETDGRDGTPQPGTVTATWTNPPKSRQSATVYLTTTDGGSSYSFKAKRSGGQIVGHTAPGLQPSGSTLCVRFKGSSHKACLEMINRNGSF
ncbi:hypothetical protein OG301_20565 [Streptomyces platensis]|uniref:hypothetical protein n=1 Tax=Streptomyces platensis TaxID=58346 RepID=UPI002E127A8D|nr:hypothetical protein OG229_17950 [Streptomyces platensis]WTI53570.1 hypothetical protein OG301_20565 [Streptomyces platensis]WUB80824.1 hypothetical protein OG424_17525 [Streptomyces platensis]